MGLRLIFIAIWYGFKWGLKSPFHAHAAGQTYGRIVGWVFGLSVLLVYPLSVILGAIYAAVKYYASGGPSG